jgi:streptomycin 6-kinase
VIPQGAAATVRAVWGADGDRWLAALPATLERLTADWQLELGEPYPMTYHWVCRARTADGADAVLKVGLGDLLREAAALAACEGRGAVRLLRQGDGALLLGRADPGTPATDLLPDGDVRATAAAVEVLRLLHTAAPSDELPSLTTTLRAFGAHLAGDTGDRLVPRALVERAAALARELRVGAPPDVLLHGDLHHDNLLRHGDGWLAIDPHGAVGDPGYDAGAWLYNPPRLAAERVVALVPRRVEQLADGLGLDVDRVVAWGFVKAVLSAVWTALDTGQAPADTTLDVAALLLPRLP